MRGYDTAEVRSFLETVADEMGRLQENVRAQSTEIEVLKSELATYQRIEKNMKEALVNAQDTLRGAREGSQREADLLRKEAELEAERIIADAHKKGEAIRRELDMLSERRTSFIRKLKGLLRSELELVELLEDEEMTITRRTGSQNQKGNIEPK